MKLVNPVEKAKKILGSWASSLFVIGVPIFVVILVWSLFNAPIIGLILAAPFVAYTLFFE